MCVLHRHLLSGNQERGSALLYILIAVALMAILTASFMQPSNQQAQSQNMYKVISSLQEQIGMIQGAIQGCVLMYPEGENTAQWVTDVGGGGTDPDAVTPYPLKPNSTHLTSPDADIKVKNLRCPGNPGGSADHADLFSAASGQFMPPAPDLFDDWQYYNGRDGVFFWTKTTKTDSYLAQALTKLDGEYSECETDYIDASSGAVDMESGTATVTCASGEQCFRYWMVRKATTAPSCP